MYASAPSGGTNDPIRRACEDVFGGWQRAISAELTGAELDPETTAELVRTQRSGEPLRAAGRQLRALVDARLASTTRRLTVSAEDLAP